MKVEPAKVVGAAGGAKRASGMVDIENGDTGEQLDVDDATELISPAERGEGGHKIDLGVTYPEDEPELSPGCYCQRYDGGRSILICTSNGRVLGQTFPFICLVGPDWPCLVVLYSLVIVPCLIFFRWALSGDLELTAL